MSDDDPTIADLVARKRASGYDREFEEMLSRPWRCPHCGHETTILKVGIPTDPTADVICPECDHEGTEPIGNGVGHA